MSLFVAYILQFHEIIVYNILPGGEGIYSQPKLYYYQIEYTFEAYIQTVKKINEEYFNIC